MVLAVEQNRRVAVRRDDPLDEGAQCRARGRPASIAEQLRQARLPDIRREAVKPDLERLLQLESLATVFRRQALNFEAAPPSAEDADEGGLDLEVGELGFGIE